MRALIDPKLVWGRAFPIGLELLGTAEAAARSMCSVNLAIVENTLGSYRL